MSECDANTAGKDAVTCIKVASVVASASAKHYRQNTNLMNVLFRGFFMKFSLY
jgi:hypothetical protein